MARYIGINGRAIVYFVVVMSTLLLPMHTLRAERKSTGNPRFDAAVSKAVEYLTSADASSVGSEASLVAYALFKSGETIESPLVKKGIEEATRRANSGYQGYEHIYLSGVDAMLLGEVNPEQYKSSLQAICNHVQRTQRADGSWAEDGSRPGDTSMAQYAMLALWAAKRAGCVVSPESVDKAALWHLKVGANDGGWSYRPGTTEGHENGRTSHNITIAAAGSLSIARLLFYGPKGKQGEEKPKEAELKFGVLAKDEPIEDPNAMGMFTGYKPQSSKGQLDDRIARAFGWNEERFSPVAAESHQPDYFFYAFERAASISDVDTVNGQDWYPIYAEGIVSLQSPSGAFEKTRLPPTVGTSFVLLYLMRSTKQILDKQYGLGRQSAKRGNPFGDEEVKREPSELDLLLSSMENMDFSKLDETEVEIADELVRSVQSIDDPEKLVGEVDRLRKLVNHPSADVRRPVYWALGRTGDYSLIPLLVNGLRDPNVDVNIEAEMALRYISHKIGGFGDSLNPLDGLPENASAEQRLQKANEWRVKAFSNWSKWYQGIRPFEDRDSFDELEAAAFTREKTSPKK